jgi:Xaa-Pro aminopeptidase
MLTRTFSDNQIFKSRRHRLTELATSDAVFILFAGPEGHLAPFRVESSFLYLTGFEEPDAVAVIRTGAKAQFTLFVRDKDPVAEVWDGERYGPELAETEFAADHCFPLSELETQLPALLKGARALYFSVGDDPINDDIVLNARKTAQHLNRRSGQAKVPIHDPNDILAVLRMVKEPIEIEFLRESCELSAQANIRLMRQVQPGWNERQALAEFLYEIYHCQASREGYSSIIASGTNACTLHYRANCRDMQDGEFLLVDAGGEKNYYTADITRTYPVNGTFTPAQRKLYQAVLDVQKALIEKVRVGFSLPQLHEQSCEWLAEKMVDLGLIEGTAQDILEEKAYQKYYPHGVGHYLGLDVHDLGVSKDGDQPVPFQVGTVITVEPGLYIPPDDLSAPAEFRGLGVRIEDDVLVTADGPEVLTASAPKEVDELEALIGSGLRGKLR